MSSDRSVRSSQLISPFGPGSIIDIGDESLLLTDLQDWPRYSPIINMPRLVNELGVSMLKAPPKSPDFGREEARHVIKTIRFPRWMFCPSCRNMKRWSSNESTSMSGKPECKSVKCNKRALVPMRFVIACEQGHMDDVPWDFWAHSGPLGKRDCVSKKHYLSFNIDTSKGSGLDALFVECNECGSKRHLGDITSPDALKSLNLKCTGSQPWEPWGECESHPVVLQRGASNLYYTIVRSALDIPGAINTNSKQDLLTAIKSTALYPACEQLITSDALDEENRLKAVRDLAKTIALDINSTIDEVMDCFSTGEKQKTERKIPETEELQLAEWEVLSSERVKDESNCNFIARVETDFSSQDRWGISSLLKRVVLLDKLREVRAFCGYERVKPGVSIIPPAGRHEDIKWLPAIEVFGEGIFIEFDQIKLKEWADKSDTFIKDRLEKLQSKYDEGKVNYLPQPTITLVLLHTFSHLLIRQLSFECGYSGGSIRERIYAADGQAGILIYTADSDSEGSLGGLVQQGEAHRLMPMIAASLDAASWCSNDPVCSEMETQGVMGLNKAACHSCTLISETSCTMNNLMLDRKLLLGNDAGEGFFDSAIKAIKNGD